ncbi:MAG: hypothetical protein GYB31_08710 [Bacteroidetes bacterium]|nr:hypothetical protein [Bacteroidota bacterium]
MQISSSLLFGFLSILFLSLPSQTDAQRKLDKYYFQLKDFEEPKVYFIHCHEDDSRDLYLRLYAKGDRLITETYSADFHMQEYAEEVFEEDESRLTVFQLFYTAGQDEVLQQSSTLDPTLNTVMRWRNTGSFGWKVRLDGDRLEMKRQVIGKQRYQYLAKRKKAIAVKDQFYLNGKLLSERTSYYGKKTGLCGFTRYEDGTVLNFSLDRIYSEEEWVVLKKG